MAHRIPKHCEHKPTGRGFVRLDGRQVYTGRWGTAEANAKYDKILAEWLASGRQRETERGTGATVLDLLAEWERHPTTKASHWGDRTKALRRALERSAKGSLEPGRFGPKAFLAMRQGLLEDRAGYCRNMVNETANHFRAFARWAVREELAPPAFLEGLRAVPSLRRGSPGVRESEPVGPVPEAVLEATRRELPQPYLDMVDVQLLTGMRPGEVRTMRPGDVDRSGEVWLYRPRGHKNAWRGKGRCVAIGPRAQAILGPWLEKRGPGEPVFRPKCRLRPYRAVSYLQAVYRAAERAGVPKWGLNRLRHNAATRVRQEFGVEAAQVVLGHSRMRTSEIYAAVNEQKAADIARRIG
jgi:integrase